MHHRRKHPTGKPQYRKNSSDWSYPPIEKGSSKQGRYSVSKMAASAKQQLKEYFNL